MYDEIKCLTCGVYQERSEGEANPAQKLKLFSLLSCYKIFRVVSTKVFAYCFVVMHLYSSTLLVVAEVDRDVGEPPTSQSITNALILYKTSFKVYLSEVPW